MPLDSVAREAVGRLIGYVGQSPFVFAGTIEENIAYGCGRVSPEDVRALQRAVRQIRVDDKLQEYLLSIVAATRASPLVYIGASTRAGLGLYRAVCARKAGSR